MKRFNYVRFRIPDGSEPEVRQLLARLELPVPAVFDNEGNDLLATSHAIRVPEPRAERLTAALKSLGIDQQPLCRAEREYTRTELRSARLFWVHVQKQKGDGYTVYGGRFDSGSTCGRCGSGLFQAGDLVVDCSDFRGLHFAATYNFEILISVELAEALKPLTGYRFGAVIDHQRGVPSEQFRQLIFTEVLPRLVPPTRFKKSTTYCQECGRNGLFLDSEMHLDEAPQIEADCYYTRELFGEVRERTCPGPELVLSWRAAEIIRGFDKRAVKLEPVYVEDRIFLRDLPPAR